MVGVRIDVVAERFGDAIIDPTGRGGIRIKSRNCDERGRDVRRLGGIRHGPAWRHWSRAVGSEYAIGRVADVFGKSMSEEELAGCGVDQYSKHLTVVCDREHDIPTQAEAAFTHRQPYEFCLCVPFQTFANEALMFLRVACCD